MRNWVKIGSLKCLSCTSAQPEQEQDFTSRAEKVILESTAGSTDDSSLGSTIVDSRHPAIVAGTDCIVKNLYPDKIGQWTEKYPTFLKTPVENDQTTRFALIVRHKRILDSRKNLEIESISIQSPFLKGALAKVFKDYPGIVTDLEQLEFNAPFEPFVHRWSQFEQATVSEKDPQVKQHLALLWNVLESELRSFLQKLKDYLRHGVVDYSNIWSVFEPNSLVVVRREGSERIYRCIRGTKTDCYYQVEGQFIDWDGEKFGYTQTWLKIMPFSGTIPITSLRVVPLDRHPDKLGIQRRVVEMAKIFEALKGYHFRSYSGTGVDATGCKVARFNVEGRVIIDTAAFNLFNPDDQVKLSGLVNDTKHLLERTNDRTVVHKVTEAAKRRRPTSSQRPGVFLEGQEMALHFCELIGEIAWDKHAFQSLVLPSDTKDLLLAFADSQIKREHTFDDFIQGKGRGTIMLLSGPPGVGKTLTAESIAEEMHVPLYMLSAGDLGSDAKDIENVLSKTLEMTTKWKAVLLLDEADVFLLARNAHDLERNKLVSIFLRMLEYYQGFLFLTTNRIEDIDAAFESRIHLSLQYSDLDAACRRTVWRNFLASCETAEGEFTEAQIAQLAKTEMNGRQIKNVVKPAQLLAAKKGSPLTYEHITVVLNLKAANQFGH